jgi:hypothetical protein
MHGWLTDGTTLDVPPKTTPSSTKAGSKLATGPPRYSFLQWPMGMQIAKVLGTEVPLYAARRMWTSLVPLGADHVIDYTQEDFTRRGRND